MPVLTVRHLTTYRYKQPVAFGEHRMMLRPRDYYDQKLLEAKLVITPEPTEIRWVHDVFGNCVAVARFSGRAQELRFESVIRLDQSATEILDFQIEEYARRYPFAYGADEMPDLLRPWSGNISIPSTKSISGRDSFCGMTAAPKRRNCLRR